MIIIKKIKTGIQINIFISDIKREKFYMAHVFCNQKYVPAKHIPHHS